MFEMELIGECFHFNFKENQLWVALVNEFLNPSKITSLLFFIAIRHSCRNVKTVQLNWINSNISVMSHHENKKHLDY